MWDGKGGLTCFPAMVKSAAKSCEVGLSECGPARKASFR